MISWQVTAMTDGKIWLNLGVERMVLEKLVITNIGQILSGKLEAPILDGDCVIATEGLSLIHISEPTRPY